jgi:hypothetical protein
MSTTPTKYEQFPSLRLYDQLGIPYVLFSQGWDGPLWTGHCMMLSIKDGYGDAGFFHELCHWIEATPAQQRMPDFALGKQINATHDSTFATSTSPYLWDGRRPYRWPNDRNVGWGESTILMKSATRQESHACTALWFYEPIVGLTSWDNPPPLDKINSAAYDFNGVSHMERTTNVIGMRKIAKAFDLDWDDLKSYAATIRKRLTEID